MWLALNMLLCAWWRPDISCVPSEHWLCVSCLFIRIDEYISTLKRSSDTGTWHSETDPGIFTKHNSRKLSDVVTACKARWVITIASRPRASQSELLMTDIRSKIEYTPVLYLSKVLANAHKFKVVLRKAPCQSVNDKWTYSNYYHILAQQNYPGNDLSVLHR